MSRATHKLPLVIHVEDVMGGSFLSVAASGMFREVFESSDEFWDMPAMGAKSS